MYEDLKKGLIDKEPSVSHTLILESLVVAAVFALLFSIYLGLERVWADFMIKSIAVNDTPIGVARNPSNGYTYVTNADSNTVSVIDSSTNTVINNIHVASHPRRIAF